MNGGYRFPRFSFLYVYLIIKPSGLGICGHTFNFTDMKLDVLECNDNYQAPIVEVIKVEVEKGFASTGGNNGDGTGNLPGGGGGWN